MPKRSKSRRVARKLIAYAEMAAIVGLVLGVFAMVFLGVAFLLGFL